MKALKPDRQKIIERVRACLKYADPKANSNEHERDNAKRLADALIAKYKITELEISGRPPDVGYREVFTTGSQWDDIVAVFTQQGIKPEFIRGWHSAEEILKSAKSQICVSCGYYGRGLKPGSNGKPMCRNCWE